MYATIRMYPQYNRQDPVSRKGSVNKANFQTTVINLKKENWLLKICLAHSMWNKYVWIYENGTKEFESYQPYFTLISLLLNAAFKPCKRRKIEKERQWKEDKWVEKKKGLTFLLIFISSLLEIVTSVKKKRPLKGRIQFFNTLFKNPDIYLPWVKKK